MARINTETELRLAILKLESTQAIEGENMKQQIQLAYESVKPINLIKSTFKEVTASEDLKDNLLNTTVGITAGYLTKKMFEGVSHAPLRKLLGTALMFGVTNAVAKNPKVVKSVAKGIFKLITDLKPQGSEHTR